MIKKQPKDVVFIKGGKTPNIEKYHNTIYHLQNLNSQFK